MVLGIVNESTSVIQILSLSGDNTVYISSSSIPGHFVSIFDQTGCATSPIYLSTVGVNPIPLAAITVPFGYVSLVSQDVSNWTIVNQAPFMLGESNIRALDAIDVKASTTTATAFSTTTATTDTIITFAAAGGQGSAGTIGIEPGPSAANFGPTYVSGTGTLASTTSYNLSTLNNINCHDLSCASVDVSGDLYFNGLGLTTSMLISMRFSTNSLACSTLTAESLSALDVTADDVTVSSAITSTITCREIDLGPAYLTISSISPMKSISISTGVVRASNIYTSSITFSELEGPLTSIQMGSTAIYNNQGSLTIKGLFTNTLDTDNITAETVRTGTVSLRTLYTDELISISGGQHLTAGNATFINLSTQNLTSVSLTATNIFTDTISPSTLTVDTDIRLGGTAFYFPNARINDISGSTSVNSVTTSLIEVGTVFTNNIRVPQLSTLRLDPVQLGATSISTITTATKGLRLETQATLGRPFNYSTLTPNAPWISTLAQDLSDGYSPLDTPPFQYGHGTGTFHDPLIVVASSNTNAYFSCSNPSGTPVYCNIKYKHVLPYPGAQGEMLIAINGNIRPVDIINQDIVFNNTDTSVTEGFIQDIEITNFDDYPFGAVNPITGDDTPYIQFYVDSANITMDSLTLWVSNNLYEVDSASQSVIDSTAGIEMNVGYMKWPSTVYTTTIQNDRNDIETRSLLYTGSLNNVSDRALKKDLEPANLQRCAAAVQGIPLRRYQYIPEFASTFQISDRTRLGILTTELSSAFPKSVGEEETPMGKTHVASLGQLKYAHLGATKFLMEEIAALKSEISRLK